MKSNIWANCCCFFCNAPVGRQRGGKQLWVLCDVVVVGAAYRLAAGGGRGRSLHADLLQTLVLEDTRKQKNTTVWSGRRWLNSSFPPLEMNTKFCLRWTQILDDDKHILRHAQSHFKVSTKRNAQEYSLAEETLKVHTATHFLENLVKHLIAIMPNVMMSRVMIKIWRKQFKSVCFDDIQVVPGFRFKIKNQACI